MSGNNAKVFMNGVEIPIESINFVQGDLLGFTPEFKTPVAHSVSLSMDLRRLWAAFVRDGAVRALAAHTLLNLPPCFQNNRWTTCMAIADASYDFAEFIGGQLKRKEPASC